MKIAYRHPIGSGEIHVTVDVPDNVHGQSKLQALFDAVGWLSDLPRTCGACSSTDIMPRTRWVKGQSGGFLGYEVVCLSCGANLQFGARREGGIYRKWDKDWYVPRERASESPSESEGPTPEQYSEDTPF
jgi:hypothetical protein